MFELSRKKCVRAGLLAGDSPDVSKLSRLKLSLNEKLEVLKQLDSEILALVEEGDVAGKIEQSDEFKEGIYAAMMGADQALAIPTPLAPRSPATVPAPLQ